MTSYTYTNPGGNIVVMALAIEKSGLPLPDGMIGSGGQVTVLFTNALTAGQESSLATLMAGSTVGQVPVTINSIYTLDDIMDLRSQLKATLAAQGITFSIYPSGPSQYKLIFDKVLTTSDKNKVVTAVGAFLKSIQ